MSDYNLTPSKRKVMQCLNHPCQTRIFLHEDGKTWIEAEDNSIHRCLYLRQNNTKEQGQQKPKPTICKYGCGHEIIFDSAIRKFRENEQGPMHLQIHDCRDWPKDENGQKYSPFVTREYQQQGQGGTNKITPDHQNHIRLPENYQLEILNVLQKIYETQEVTCKYIQAMRNYLGSILEEIQKMNDETITFEDGHLTDPKEGV